MTVRFNAACAAIAALCLPLAAQAQSRETVQARIPTADLNLASNAGIGSLQARIDGSIRRACHSTLGGFAAAADSARCRREMKSDASAKVASLLDRSATVQVASAR